MIIGELKQILKKRSFMQTFAVLSSNVFVLGIGFLLNMILARKMGANSFGIFSFCNSIFGFLAIFMEFGFYSTASKLLADTDNEIEERKLLGAILIIYIMINAFFSLLLFAASFVLDSIFKIQVGDIIKSLFFSGYAYTAPFFMEWILKGCNKVYILSTYNFINKLLYAIFVLILCFTNMLAPRSILLFFAISAVIPFIFSWIRLKPIFTDVFYSMKKLYVFNDKYGFPQYIGRIADVGAVQLNTILISLFVDAESVGFYSLAVSFINVISLISRSFCIAKFKSLANDSYIKKNIIKVVNFVTILSTCAVLAFAAIAIFFFLQESYYPVFKYILILMFGAIAQSLYSPYLSWLSGKGYAKELRNASFKICGLDMLINISFIWLLGGNGACIAFSVGYLYTLYLYKTIYKKYMIIQ